MKSLLTLALASALLACSPSGKEDTGRPPADTGSGGDTGSADTGAPDTGSGVDTGDSGGDTGVGGLELAFVEVPAGTYTVGSPEDEVGREPDDLYRHQVTLTHGFLVGVTEVTQAQFEALAGFNPSYTDPSHPLCPDCPVDQVRWSEAAWFCNLLSEQEGLETCYDCTGEGRAVQCTPAGSPYDCGGYRLPTEAEWEIAARGGSTAAFPNGGNLVPGTEYQFSGEVTLDNGETIGSFAWYANNSGDRSHEVAQLEPNAYGLYDVVGNVDEWAHDAYAPLSPSDGDVTDPLGPETGEDRICRGGAFNTNQVYLRLAYRNWYAGEQRWWVVGFRVARTLDP